MKAKIKAAARIVVAAVMAYKENKRIRAATKKHLAIIRGTCLDMSECTIEVDRVYLLDRLGKELDAFETEIHGGGTGND